MGFFSKLKKFGEQMEAASQQMMNTQLTVTLDNQQVKIGEQLSGTITITSKTPCIIQGFKISLLRELGTVGSVGQSDKKQWVFNKEDIQSPLLIPDPGDGTYDHKLTVMAKLEGTPIGPTGGVDNIIFVYPSFSPA